MLMATPFSCSAFIGIGILGISIYFILLNLELENTYGLIPEAGTLPILNSSSASLSDTNFKVEVVASGLDKPTNMAFLSSGDILVLEKNTGLVKKIANSTVLEDPMFDANVSTFDTRGMLGIAVTRNETLDKEYVFLYYTEAKKGEQDGKDKCFTFSKCDPEHLPNGNRLYRFELSEAGTKLVNQKIIFAWPPFSGATHNGGELRIGPDNNIYITVGDGEPSKTLTANYENSEILGYGGILALDHNGNPAFKNGILGSEDPLNRYYAYGIRNSFGFDFDPITGNLWDTENGPGFGDEINFVEPGFNSGSKKVQGFWNQESYFIHDYIGDLFNDTSKLENFGGKGKYSPPEFATGNHTIGITAIEFLDSNKYGHEYENDIFVGSAMNYGIIYHFNLNKDRTELDLSGSIVDKVANNYAEMSNIIFAGPFDTISDITVGPDGYMYIVSNYRGEIYRIVPK